MAVEPTGDGLWQHIQPWVQGLIAPAFLGAGVAFKFLVGMRQKSRETNDSERKDADDYRLKDRVQISAATEAMIERMSKEISALLIRVENLEVQNTRAWNAFYSTIDRWRNMRHEINGIMAALYLDWQTGKPAPAKWPDLPPVPTADDILNSPEAKR